MSGLCTAIATSKLPGDACGHGIAVKLIDMLPGFGTELRQALEAANRRDLAAQIALLVLESYRYDVQRHRTTLTFAPQPLIEGEVMAASGDSVEVPHRRLVIVDTDAAGNIRKIALESGTDVAEGLYAFSPLRQ